MKRRSATGRWVRAMTLAAVAAIFAALSTVQAQAFPDVCKIRLDERRAADLLERAQRDGGMDISELLRQVGSVEVRGRVPARLVLYVYLMRGDEVVRRYASRSFNAPARGMVSLRDVLRAGEPEFGTFTFDPANLLEAVEMVPAGAAVDEPGRFVINGVIPFHPKGWERMAGVYIVAAPVSGERATGSLEDMGWPISREAPVGIGVLFGTPARSGR
jgi:hypothetical protein